MSKLAIWIEGADWLTPDRIEDAPADNVAPGGGPGHLDGAQQICIGGQWAFILSPAAVQDYLTLRQTVAQRGGQQGQQGQQPPQQAGQAGAMSAPQNPMGQMSQLMEALPMMMIMGMMQNMMGGMTGMAGLLPQVAPRQPLDIQGLKGVAAAFGEQVVSAMKAYKGLKGP